MGSQGQAPRLVRENLAINSMSRDPMTYKDSSNFVVDLTRNPLRNVVRIQLSQSFIPRAQSNIVRDRAFKWAWQKPPAQ